MSEEYKYFKNQYLDDIRENYFKPVLDDVFKKYGKNIKVMGDVGCGNGIFSTYLKREREITLCGFDASEYALECALRKGMDKVFLNEDFSTRALQVNDAYFDFVLNKDVLEHLMDPEFLIKEIARVLKPDGLFLLHVPNDFNLWKRIQFVFSNSIDTYSYCPGAKQWNWPHIRFFTFEGIKELLHMHGFEIIENYSSFFAHRLSKIHRIPGYMPVARLLAGRYPSHFSQAVSVLTKRGKKA